MKPSAAAIAILQATLPASERQAWAANPKPKQTLALHFGFAIAGLRALALRSQLNSKRRDESSTQISKLIIKAVSRVPHGEPCPTLEALFESRHQPAPDHSLGQTIPPAVRQMRAFSLGEEMRLGFATLRPLFTPSPSPRKGEGAASRPKSVPTQQATATIAGQPHTASAQACPPPRANPGTEPLPCEDCASHYRSPRW